MASYAALVVCLCLSLPPAWAPAAAWATAATPPSGPATTAPANSDGDTADTADTASAADTADTGSKRGKPLRLTPSEAEAELRHARNEYSYGDYAAAAARLNTLLYPMQLTTDDQVVEAHKWLALSYHLLERYDGAREEFAKLLYRDPDYQLDPFAVAPNVIESFEAVRAKLKTELDVIRQRRVDKQLELPQAAGWRRIIETRVLERSDIATFLPFGIGQFQNGDLGWGVAMAMTQLALLGANVGAHMWARQLGTYSASERGKIQALSVTQYGSLALLGIAWSLGVYQARRNFAPVILETPIVRDEPIEIPEPPVSSVLPGTTSLHVAWTF